MEAFLGWVLGMCIAVPIVVLVAYFAHPGSGAMRAIGFLTGIVSVMCATAWLTR